MAPTAAGGKKFRAHKSLSDEIAYWNRWTRANLEK